MDILKKRSIIILMILFILSVVSTHPQKTIGDLFKKKQKAESLEEYAKRCIKGNVTGNDFHNDGKFMLIMGNKTIAVDKEKAIQLLRYQKEMGATIELLEFKILNMYQTDDRISVVLKYKAKAKIGNTEMTTETISHEILMKSGNSFVTVFSIEKQ